MKSSQPPYPLKYDVPLRQPLAPEDSSVRPVVHRTVQELFLWLSLGAEYSGLRVAEGLPSGLGGSGEILRDDTSGSSASRGGEAQGGVSLSIISGRISPEEELCREGLRSELQDIRLGYCPQK